MGAPVLTQHQAAEDKAAADNDAAGAQELFLILYI